LCLSPNGVPVYNSGVYPGGAYLVYNSGVYTQVVHTRCITVVHTQVVYTRVVYRCIYPGGVYPGSIAQYASLLHHGGYTSLCICPTIPPWVYHHATAHAVHMTSGMRGVQRRGPGLCFSISYDHEAHRGLLSPKSVTVVRQLCAELLRFSSG